MKMKPVIELDHIHKIYDLGEVKLNILNDINMKIYKGEHVSVIGPSGSGKSTILNMAGCLDRPTQGKVFIDGTDVWELSDSRIAKIRSREIGFVFQFFYLIPNLTALENVKLPMVFAGDMNEEKARENLKMVGLGHRMHHKPSQLSGGERQRTAIARALANDPKILFADEPTGNLDSKSGHEIIEILKKLNREYGVTLVVVTHDQSLAKLGNRTICIIDGKITKTEGKEICRE
jgi:putative ABC transport system ATP-binding protein